MVSQFFWVISVRARCENSLFGASTVLSSARTVISGVRMVVFTFMYAL